MTFPSWGAKVSNCLPGVSEGHTNLQIGKYIMFLTELITRKLNTSPFTLARRLGTAPLDIITYPDKFF